MSHPLPHDTLAPRAPRRGAFAALLAAAGLLAATAASATTYYVSTSGSDSNNGTSVSTPWRTIGKATATMVAGDQVRISPGTYSETLTPQSNGTSSNRITYMGDLANPSGVAVSGLRFSGQDYVSIKGMQFASEILIQAATSGNSSDRDSLLYCKGLSGISLAGATWCVVANCSIGQGGPNDKLNISNYANSVTQYCTLQDNNFNFATVSGGNAMTGYYMQNNRFIRNRYKLTLLPGAADTHLNTLYRTHNNTWIDCHYDITNLAGFEVYMLNQRDSSSFNVWSRDTFTVNPASTMTVKCEFATSGAYPNTVNHNTYLNCFFQVDGILGYQDWTFADRFENNVFVFKQAFQPKGDSIVFIHNTFYNATGGRVWSAAQNDVSRTTISGNLFYGTGSASNGHVAYSDIASNVANDNLFYATGNDPANAVYSISSSRTSAVGSGTLWCTTYGKDCASSWADPQLRTASWNAPDLRPASGSPAYATHWPGGYAGAFPESSLQGDVTPPAAISNLAVSQPQPNSLLLTWTAPGDDGSTGLAAAYDIRWSTSPINASNFSTATPFTAVPDPFLAGQTQTYVALGLQPATPYWFAIRTRDESSNWSDISNVATGTTGAADTTPPAAINDLGATP